MYAIQARRKTVTEKHFLDAVNKVIKGYQKFSATPKYMGMTLEEYQKPKGMNSNAREQVAGTGNACYASSHGEVVNEGEKTLVSDKSFNVEDSNDEKKKNAVNESEEKELEDKVNVNLKCGNPLLEGETKQDLLKMLYYVNNQIR
ncbi:hypothetical protein HanXRQr2_Chr16g0774701 [Helianthus annuus]|uniref:Uncharacterized protein n=1 Tax=Helianthus annuus TaxID=4232 RepID=A0A9K3H013_HELAN|nr:hypothetical protein HanXRQr2_Chr16g0774701 [Helianthus annuus]KAJ0823390.1 hypothetical protein HanPSC8_Chr16g0743111 [Helianthus annuus]